MKNNWNISEEEFEHIEKYHLGSLTAEETLRFEKEMDTSVEFAQKAKEVGHLIKGIETATLQGTLNTFHESFETVQTVDREKNDKSNRAASRIPIYAIAAVLIVVFGLLWFFNSDTPSEKLFAKHFIPDPGLPTNMGEVDNFKFYDGMVSYKQDDYETALKKWNPLLNERPENDTLNYFIGVAYLANGDEEEAILQLKKLITSKPQSFKNEASYYLGLAYLKVENLEEAKKYLIFSDTERAQQVLSDFN